MTDTLLTDVLGKEPFTWGNGDLSNQNDVRDIYFRALRLVDTLDYEPLKRFVRS